MTLDRSPLCPACDLVLQRLEGVQQCRSCRAQWIDEAALAARVEAVDPAALPLVFTPRGSDGLACPACREVMTSHRLEGIHVNRCGVHGVWLEARNLAAVLHAAATRPQSSVAPSRVSAGAVAVLGFFAEIVDEVLDLVDHGRG